MISLECRSGDILYPIHLLPWFVHERVINHQVRRFDFVPDIQEMIIISTIFIDPRVKILLKLCDMVIYYFPEIIRHPGAQRSEVFGDILDISSFEENIQMWMEEISGTGMIAIFAPLRAAVFAIPEPMIPA